MWAPSVPLLVGRDRELGLLRALLEDSLRGGTVAVVRGDAGTGKSALLAMVGGYAEDRQMLVLRASGVHAEARMPFAGLHQLLWPVLSSVGALAEEYRGVLLGAFGTSDADPEVFLVGLAALNLLSDIAAGRPVALLVDDAQWMDGATIEVLAFIARRLDADPVALIVSHRSGFAGPLDGPGVRETELRGLDAHAAAELLDARFPDLGGGEREAVMALAAGNPLALLELPKALAEASSQPGDDMPLPRRLERAFAGRTLDLPTTAQSALLVSAVDEQLSLAEVLSATSTLVGEPVTLDDLASAESAGLVRLEGQTIQFCHPLMSSAVRQAASTARRRRAHAAIADTLHGDLLRSVWHRAACALGPDDTIATQLEATGLELRRRDGSLAVAALRRAGELSSTPVRRGRRLVAAAELALELGRDEEVAQLLDHADPLPLDTRTRHSMLWLREALKEASGTGTVPTMVDVAEQLIAEGDVRAALRALFTAAVRCYMFKIDAADSAAVATAAENLGLPADDPSVAAIRALATPAARGVAVVASLEAVTPQQVVTASPDATAAAEAVHLCALALTCLGEFRLGVGFQDAAIAGFRSQGRLGLLSRALGSHSVVRLALADWRAASQAADAALASGNAREAVAMLEPLDRVGGTDERRGTAAYADAVLSEGDFEERFQTALALAPPSVFFQSRLQLAYGTRLRRERRSIDARGHLRSAADGFEAIGAVPWSERAREELRASGETIRHHAPERRDELSPQEMQIAELAAEGLSNRQIAARLFVSHRTVGSHLYKIFPKLGIASRAELAAALREPPHAA